MSKERLTAEEILSEYVNFDNVNGNKPVRLLPLTIVDMLDEFAAQEVEAAIADVTKQRDELLEACKMMTEALNHGNFELLIPEYEVMMTVISKVEWDNLEDFNQPIDKPIVM
jgi:hypothetical protein